MRRALALLESFDDANPEWRASELAKETGLNRTTVYRLLSALEHAGLLRQDPRTDRYRLGPGAVALGARAARQSDLQSAARPELESLAEDVGETATLEVLAGSETLILAEAPGPAVLGLSAEIGTRWPAHATSSGKALLAWSGDDGSGSGPGSGTGDGDPDLSALADPLPRYTGRTLTTREALRRELERVRERGFATAENELEKGYVAAAAPIREGSGDVVAAVSVAGPASRLSADRLEGVGRRVRETALRISRRLGAPVAAGDQPVAGRAGEANRP